MDILLTGGFWLGLAQVIWVNLLLSGDNAVVIALAARSLPRSQQGRAVFWGSSAAIVLRILLTVFAVKMLGLPYLKLIGGVLLIWIGVQLLAGDHDENPDIKSGSNLLSAIRTILVADVVMSLDNVIGLAAAAEGAGPRAKMALLVLGLGISIPIVILGSTWVLKLIRRWPVIVKLGAALLGWIAGEMAIADPVVNGWVAAEAGWLLDWKTAEVMGAVVVILVGLMLARKPPPRSAAPDVGGA
jgi:YjbE family integral membrane protein